MHQAGEVTPDAEAEGNDLYTGTKPHSLLTAGFKRPLGAVCLITALARLPLLTED